MPKFSVVTALIALAFANSVASAQFAGPARTQQPGLFTETSIEKGWQSASQRRQPMLVMFTSENCRYCKKMLAETYGHPGVQQMLVGRTQTVLAHADDYKALVKKLGIRGYPSSVLISAKGDVLDFMEGYVAPKDFAQRVSPLLGAQATPTRAAQSLEQKVERK